MTCPLEFEYHVITNPEVLWAVLSGSTLLDNVEIDIQARQNLSYRYAENWFPGGCGKYKIQQSSVYIETTMIPYGNHLSHITIDEGTRMVYNDIKWSDARIFLYYPNVTNENFCLHTMEKQNIDYPTDPIEGWIVPDGRLIIKCSIPPQDEVIVENNGLTYMCSSVLIVRYFLSKTCLW